MSSSKKAIFAESTEYLSDMCSMDVDIIGVDEDIVQINYYANIDHVGEDVVHKPLKGSGGVCEAKWHYSPFKRSVSRSECGFPLITFGYAD